MHRHRLLPNPYVISTLALVAGLCLAPTASQARPGCRVIVYRDSGFQGPSETIGDDQSFVGPIWNDQISSIQVLEGRWVFFKDANYQRGALNYGPGNYPRVPPDWNDQISSLKCVAGGAPDAGGEGDVAPPDLFSYGGQSYGWYDDGWNRAGFYVVGFAYRFGRGFGGREGFHGWHHHGRGGHHGGHDHGGGRHHGGGGHNGGGGGHHGGGGGHHGGGGGHRGGGGGHHGGGGGHHGGGGGHHGGGGGHHGGGGGHHR